MSPPRHARADTDHADSSALDADALVQLRLRTTPELYIIERDGTIVFSCGQGSVPTTAWLRIARQAIFAGVPPSGSFRQTENLALRIHQDEGRGGERYCVFIEKTRGADLSEVARRFALTVRETDVLRQMLQGQNTIEIAQSLGITEATVADHIKRLASKTDARNRSQIIVRIMRGF